VSEPTRWARVFHGARLQCDLVVAVLESHGIHAEAPGSGIQEYVGAVFEESEVFVPEADAERASEVLKSGDPGIHN
jgi:hypothetical protein